MCIPAAARADEHLRTETTPHRRSGRAATFETFVRGDGNAAALDACTAFAEPSYAGPNPLFLHGGRSAGKTHLLHAVAERLTSRDPGARVHCLRADRYADDLCAAVRRGPAALVRLHRSFLAYTAVLVDDAHAFAVHDMLAGELLALVERLAENGVRVALASDRTSAELLRAAGAAHGRHPWHTVPVERI